MGMPDAWAVLSPASSSDPFTHLWGAKPGCRQAGGVAGRGVENAPSGSRGLQRVRQEGGAGGLAGGLSARLGSRA